jgi:dihydrofolate reductase
MAYSIEDAIEKMDSDKENFIIGGASIYRQFMPYADKLYITWVHKSFDADTFFPEVDEKEWREISREDITDTDDKNPYPHSFVIYERR